MVGKNNVIPKKRLEGKSNGKFSTLLHLINRAPIDSMGATAHYATHDTRLTHGHRKLHLWCTCESVNGVVGPGRSSSTWFRNVASDFTTLCLMPCIRRYFLWPCIRLAVQVWLCTVLTKSKLTPRKGQITFFLYVRANFLHTLFSGPPLFWGSGYQTICLFRGVNLLLRMYQWRRMRVKVSNLQMHVCLLGSNLLYFPADIVQNFTYHSPK